MSDDAKLALFEAVRETTSRYDKYKRAWQDYREAQFPAGSPLAGDALTKIRETLSDWGNAWETRARGVMALGLQDKRERDAALREGAQFLEKALDGYSHLNQHAVAQGVKRFAPSDEAFSELQIMLCNVDPERASALWAKLDAAGLPTAGFVAGRTEAMVAPLAKPHDRHGDAALASKPLTNPPPSPSAMPNAVSQSDERTSKAEGQPPARPEPSQNGEGRAAGGRAPAEKTSQTPESPEGKKSKSQDDEDRRREPQQAEKANKQQTLDSDSWLAQIPNLPAAAWRMLLQARKVLPVLNYAIGAVGVVTAATIALWLSGGDGGAAVTGFVLVMAGMVVLLIVSKQAKSNPDSLRGPGRVIVWVVTIVFSLVLAVGVGVKAAQTLQITPKGIADFAQALRLARAPPPCKGDLALVDGICTSPNKKSPPGPPEPSVVPSTSASQPLAPPSTTGAHAAPAHENCTTLQGRVVQIEQQLSACEQQNPSPQANHQCRASLELQRQKVEALLNGLCSNK